VEKNERGVKGDRGGGDDNNYVKPGEVQGGMISEEGLKGVQRVLAR